MNESREFSFSKQQLTGKGGKFRIKYVDNNEKPTTIAKFKELASKRQEQFEQKHGTNRTYEEIEQLILNNQISKINIYGSDVQVTTSNENNEVLNLYKISDSIREYTKKKGNMPGISDPYEYVGSIGSVFAWHTEDINFSSISILLCGQPKIWYAIPPSKSKEFEQLVIKNRPKSEKCDTYLRHKDTWFTPDFIINNGINVTKVNELL